MASREKDLSGKHVGKVVANDHPSGKAMVRVEIPGITSGQPVEAMPWFQCYAPLGLGGSPYTSFFAVPQLQTEVVVEFPDLNSVQSGVVVATPLNEKTIPKDQAGLASNYKMPTASETHFTSSWGEGDRSGDGGENKSAFNPDMTEDYPFTWGWVDNAMNWFRVNMMKRTTEFVLNNFFKFKSWGNGNTLVHVPGNMKIIIERDLYLEIRGSTDIISFNSLYEHVLGNRVRVVEGVVQEEAKKGYTLNGKTINLN